MPISIFLSLVLLISSGFTFGQGRSSRNRNLVSRTGNATNTISRHESNTGSHRVTTTNPSNERTSYNYSRNKSRGGSNAYSYTPRESDSNKMKKEETHYYVNGDNHKGNKNNKHDHNEHSSTFTYAYHHPKTYHTWHYPAPWVYAPHAIVFRHHHGDYFFYHGSFYRYHPVRGYYRVAVPGSVVFSHLPVGYEKVFIGGGYYYRYGKVFFEYTPYGYRIIPRPSGLIITARF